MQTVSDSIVSEAASRRPVPHPCSPGERISYTLQTAAEVVDLSIATLHRLEKAGRLRFIRIGGRTLVCAKSLHALAA